MEGVIVAAREPLTNPRECHVFGSNANKSRNASWNPLNSRAMNSGCQKICVYGSPRLNDSLSARCFPSVDAAHFRNKAINVRLHYVNEFSYPSANAGIVYFEIV
jgi:hypothetical protein